MGTRRKSRELALQVLFQGDMAKQSDLLDFDEFCVHFQVNKKAIPYAKKLLAGMSLVALLGGAGLTVSGCVATTGSATANGQNDEAIDTSERDNTDGNLSG